MTKKEANQLYYINREIRMWQKELDQIRQQSLIKSPDNEKVGHSTTVSDATANMVMKTFEIEETIQSLYNKAAIQKSKIMKFANEIPNSCDRQIFFLRAAACLPWSVIADKVGGNNTEDSVRMRYNRLFYC